MSVQGSSIFQLSAILPVQHAGWLPNQVGVCSICVTRGLRWLVLARLDVVSLHQLRHLYSVAPQQRLCACVACVVEQLRLAAGDRCADTPRLMMQGCVMSRVAAEAVRSFLAAWVLPVWGLPCLMLPGTSPLLSFQATYICMHYFSYALLFILFVPLQGCVGHVLYNTCGAELDMLRAV
ncbi:hypothetical protein COO60DRAFT_1459486 [Scenedesmus sp. NREL 46B-D3]|nr:hypothetical protein COO60DRAFT_1459486 [Scenedesmus sp. NREL 46B-D3]